MIEIVALDRRNGNAYFWDNSSGIPKLWYVDVPFRDQIKPSYLHEHITKSFIDAAVSLRKCERVSVKFDTRESMVAYIRTERSSVEMTSRDKKFGKVSR